MDRLKSIINIRKKLSENKPSIGSWIQIPNASVAEIMGKSGFDWVAVDLEHGSISTYLLPDLFRALELGNTLPLARLAQGNDKDIKEALDAGAGGIIVPMVESGNQLKDIRNASCWPPLGSRGVGFSRANLYGKYFNEYKKESQQPLLIAMIESEKAIKNLESILSVEGLDAILIGPYDLSASMGIIGDFSNQKFVNTIDKILKLSNKHKIKAGIHIVEPSKLELEKKIEEGYKFIAYSLDSVMLLDSADQNKKKE
jgi:2-dehydro-3-deoxyglucarate aldolase